MGVIIYSFNFNISPKMSYVVLECDIVMLQNYAYDKKHKNGHYLYQTMHIYSYVGACVYIITSILRALTFK